MALTAPGAVPAAEAHAQAQPQAEAHGNLPDAGLVMGQSCRVGWAPGGMYACASEALAGVLACTGPYESCSCEL